MKKLISTFIALFFIITSVSSVAYAEGFEYEFENYSRSLIMTSMDTGEVVYANNPDEILSVASLTKIMTYIVAYENIEDIENTLVSIDPESISILNSTYSSMSNIIANEQLTVLQLLNMMMVPSGNDASLAIAMYYDKLNGFLSEPSYDGNGVDLRAYDMGASPFIKLMNDKAKELGCYSTNFTNPHGLYNQNHYSTARDMAVIARYATTLPYFSEISGQLSYTLPPTNLYSSERTVYTSNRMLSSYYEEGEVNYYYTYATGMKTGSLTQSGYCIASSAMYEGYSYIVIALGSPMYDANNVRITTNGAMLDSAELFRWAFLNLENKTVVTKGSLLGDVALEYAWNKNRIQVVAADNVQFILPIEASLSSVSVELDLPESIQAPVKQGDILGVATIKYQNTEFATVNLIASESVDRSTLMQIVETGQEFIASPIFVIAVLAAVLMLIIFISISISYNKKKRRMKRGKRL